MPKELIGIIGGTGLGDALINQIENPEPHDVETPFGKPSTPIIIGNLNKKNIAFLNRHGQGHKFPPSQVPFAANIFALKKLGVHTVISSGAVGSLREEITPGDLVIVDQFIDKTFKRQNSFFDEYGAVHCEMATPICNRLCQLLQKTAHSLDINTHPAGTYVCMEGPQFSTRAESLMHISWGGDLIGMTAMPEAKLAREAQMCYAMIALASDYDCWRPHKKDIDKQTLLEEIISNLQHATDNCMQLIKAVLNSDSELINESCQCRKSLNLAVWTDKKQIDPNKDQQLKILFD